MPALRIQIASDLHLETPLQTPTYARFSNSTNFPVHATNLFLLGDIGLAKHPQLFIFLTALLTYNPSLSVFYVLGNHEPYGTTLELAIQKFEDYEKDIERRYGQKRFYFLNRRRVDLNEKVTVLGCTLWTQTPPPQPLHAQLYSRTSTRRKASGNAASNSTTPITREI
jgi:predicted MPP superfamily phosphohydrolase